MGHAELAAPFLAIGVDVDADDLVGADHPGALDDVESDPAETEDDDRLARLNLCGVDHRADPGGDAAADVRSEEHTSELQSLMRISYAVFCLKKKKHKQQNDTQIKQH